MIIQGALSNQQLVTGEAPSGNNPISTRTRVHLHMGQSNKKGQNPPGTIPAKYSYLVPANPNVKIWDGAAFVNIEAGVNTTQPLLTSDFGSEVSQSYFCNIFWNDGIDYVIKWAYNATDIADFSPGGSFYNSIVTFVNDALADISANENDYSVVMYWDQGENDGNSSKTLEHAQGYRDDFNAMITDYRSVFNLRKLPVVIRKMRHDATAFPYISEIITQQINIINTVPDTVLLSNVNDLRFNDGIHFDGPSVVELGIRELHLGLYLYD